MRMLKGWTSPRAYRCRAAHYVGKTNVVALCGAPIRTLVAPKKAGGWLVCDKCQSVRRRDA